MSLRLGIKDLKLRALNNAVPYQPLPYNTNPFLNTTLGYFEGVGSFRCLPEIAYFDQQYGPHAATGCSTYMYHDEMRGALVIKRKS
jgi:hypothetical protein